MLQKMIPILLIAIIGIAGGKIAIDAADDAHEERSREANRRASEQIIGTNGESTMDEIRKAKRGIVERRFAEKAKPEFLVLKEDNLYIKPEMCGLEGINFRDGTKALAIKKRKIQNMEKFENQKKEFAKFALKMKFHLCCQPTNLDPQRMNEALPEAPQKNNDKSKKEKKELDPTEPQLVPVPPDQNSISLSRHGRVATGESWSLPADPHADLLLEEIGDDHPSQGRCRHQRPSTSARQEPCEMCSDCSSDEDDDDAVSVGSRFGEADACLICFERAPDAVAVDCGHGGLCYSCAVDVACVHDVCPMCRAPMRQVVKIEPSRRYRLKHTGDVLVPVVGPHPTVWDKVNSFMEQGIAEQGGAAAEGEEQGGGGAPEEPVGDGLVLGSGLPGSEDFMEDHLGAAPEGPDWRQSQPRRASFGTVASRHAGLAAAGDALAESEDEEGGVAVMQDPVLQQVMEEFAAAAQEEEAKEGGGETLPTVLRVVRAETDSSLEQNDI